MDVRGEQERRVFAMAALNSLLVDGDGAVQVTPLLADVLTVTEYCEPAGLAVVILNVKVRPLTSHPTGTAAGPVMAMQADDCSSPRLGETPSRPG